METSNNFDKQPDKSSKQYPGWIIKNKYREQN